MIKIRNYTTPDEYINLIKSALTEFPQTIKDISSKIERNPNVVSKYLDILNARGEISMARIGNTKCFFVKAIKTD